MLNNLLESELTSFLNMIKGIQEDSKILFDAVLKLKKLVVGFLTISHKCEETEAFAKNMNLICDILNCDRASIFLHDKLKNTLWTAVAKDIPRIEIPANKGIAGSVFSNGKNIIIDDPYTDKRFNPESDKKNNFLTRSILCVPIIGDDNEKIGVCQAINSRNPMFSLDDEKLLMYLSKHAGAILKNSLDFQQRFMLQNLQKNILDV